MGLSLLKRSRAGATSHDRNSLSLSRVVNPMAVTLGVYAAFHAPSWRLPEWLPEESLGGALFLAGLILR